MKVNWIIEKYLFEEYEQELCETIRDSGNSFLLMDDSDYKFDFDKDVRPKFKDDDCVIFYGSLQRGRQLYAKTPWIPGIYLTINNYECYKYYRYYGDDLLNHDYEMFPIGELLRKEIRSRVLNHFDTDRIFIRPSNGYKTFTGQLLKKDQLDKDFDVLIKSYGGVDLETLVIVAKEQTILEEYRFIIIHDGEKNHIVDGCLYMVNGVTTKSNKIDTGARTFVESILDNYTPDLAFTIDVAKLPDDTFKVIEINSCCCAGWYNMNLKTVVDEMNKLVINDYNSYKL